MNITEVTETVSINIGYTKFYGFSLKTSVNVDIEFRNGLSGSSVVFVHLDADESIQQRFDTPIRLTEGLYVESSDTIEGTVWWSEYEAVEGEVIYPIQDDTRGATAPE